MWGQVSQNAKECFKGPINVDNKSFSGVGEITSDIFYNIFFSFSSKDFIPSSFPIVSVEKNAVLLLTFTGKMSFPVYYHYL